jgi:hypothetical protein
MDKDWNVLNDVGESLKIKNKFVPLSDPEYFEIFGGFQPPINRIPDFELSESEFNKIPNSERQIIFPAIVSAHSIKRYEIDYEGRYWIIANSFELQELQKHYPKLYSILEKRIDKKTKNWWKFPNIRNFTLFQEFPIKLLSPRTASRNSFAVDKSATLFKGTNSAIACKKMDTYFVAGVLNSKFADEWYSKHGTEYHGSTKKYEPKKIRKSNIPIPIVSKEKEQRIAELVKQIEVLNNKISKMSNTTEKSDLSQKVIDIEAKIDEEVNSELFG